MGRKKSNTSPDPRDYIVIRGARVNNLKNIDLDIPKYKLVVFTGVSGSGKSSIVFDTIYAEGQRRYVESLSSYARQFLERMNKPDVEFMSGLAPSMAIEQKAVAKTGRSTVGTSTEIYDYLRLLYARIGDTYSPVSNKLVKKDYPASIIKELALKQAGKLYIYCTLRIPVEEKISKKLAELKSKGFYKILIKDEVFDLNDISEKEIQKKIETENDIYILNSVIDRFTFDDSDPESITRMNDSLEMAFKEGGGYLTVRVYKGDTFEDTLYSRHFELDGIRFEEPEPRFFSFNNPYGACEKCQGFGKTMDIDMDIVIPDKRKSLVENAINVFSTPKHSKHYSDLIREAPENGVDIYIPFQDLSEKDRNFVFNGNKRYIGIYKFFRYIEKEASYKLHYRILLNRYRAYTTCSSCGGSRLRKEALYVKISDKNIFEVVRMKIEEAYEFFLNLKPDDYKKKISERILEEIISRLKYLNDVGLTYLTLDRISNTLSGGEAQRINLSTSLGSSLVGSIYVLDEPTIGLHPRDNEKLINIMKSLRDIGNTVLVVEHDAEMMKEADEIIDIGPLAGEQGGKVIFQGSYNRILKHKTSLTGKYLSGREKISPPEETRTITSETKFVNIYGARENNLKNVNVSFPLKQFVCITGVSGSGKSTLVQSIIYAGLKKKLDGFYTGKIGDYNKIEGAEYIDAVELVDQSPIGKTSRSNPVTYIKAFDEIRDTFASTNYAKRKHLSGGYFSFNVPGGRCETCEGTGVIKVEMQFMADIYLECEVCRGKRYKMETLEVNVKGADGTGKNIYEVLEMTVNEAIQFFKPYPKIIRKLKVLGDVGLGYIKLGQSGTTLSGGESQRVKLAYYLTFQSENSNKLFIFDEPTTGLHYYDISKLLKCFDALIQKGNSIVVIEHNLEVIKCADYIIDLGPDCGDKGGEVVASGTPEEIIKSVRSFTGKYLKGVR
ncbi:MAG: excinuclease ABC subunit UvrA [Ignavibacteriae bacterium]|nr:excinuclease ABC subunit UvrA [Ignavibacteriota bacterium]